MIKTIEFDYKRKEGKRVIVIDKISCVELLPQVQERSSDPHCPWVVFIDLGNETISEVYGNWNEADTQYNKILKALNGKS